MSSEKKWHQDKH